jgi:electron transfer flavoprotein alpha subunit
MQKLAFLAPQRGGVLAPIALELATAARGLGTEVTAYSFGEGAERCAAALGAYGVGELAVLDLDPAALPAPGLAAAIAVDLAPSATEALLLPSTYDGRDVAARLSARLDRPVLANVVGLAEEEGRLTTEHAVFGGRETVRARLLDGAPGLYLVRPKSFEASPSGGEAARLRQLAAGGTGASDRARVVAHHVEAQEGPALEDAAIVVSGGRGLGDKEHYQLIEQLAGLLGAAAGASRAVVDAGWTPYARQVGQTGKTVKPEVYLACGISGATQHLVGMKGSRHIVAINRDASAPIFSLAELGIVGDLHEILPRLIAALQARN